MSKRSSKRGSLLDEMAEAAQAMEQELKEDDDEDDDDDLSEGYDPGEEIPDYTYEQNDDDDVYGYERQSESDSASASFADGSTGDSSGMQQSYEDAVPIIIGSSANLRYTVMHEDEAGISPMSTPSSAKSVQKLGKFLSSRSRKDQSIRLSGSSGVSGTHSISSAPMLSSSALPEEPHRRRQTYVAPDNDEPQSGSRRGARRQQIYFRPSVSGQSQVSNLSDDQNSSMGSVHNNRKARNRSITQRRSHRQSRMSATTAGSSSRLNMSDAVNRLGMVNQDGSNWDNVLAAASVVAASSQAPTMRTIQYGQGDAVLCMLTLLNITNHDDDPVDFTIDPVNVHGYPDGEGKTEAERSGPHSFVLGTVVTVHFDEDERYYTVRRHDTGTEQRADPQWMEQCVGGTVGIEAAEAAAKRSTRAANDANEQAKKVQHKSTRLASALAWPIRFATETMIPSIVFMKNTAKLFMYNMLTGEKGYGCRFKLTCINVLVLSSFIYLMIEPFTYAFLPASMDRSSAILEL